jgi:peptidoglycan-N-acetylglucosamine deacetylase
MSKLLPAVSRRLKALAHPFVGTITHVSTSIPVAALTFDDGPDPRFTPRLLEVLERHGATATFFMVGENARRYPQLVRQVAEAGHAIGNHSWDHPSFPSISGRERRRQVRACAAALPRQGLRLFRSPGGHQTPRSVLDVRLMGYEMVGWNVDPRDYRGRSAREIRDQVLEEIRPGSIILLHDALFDHPSGDRQPTIEAVDMILSRARASYEFTTVPELLKLGDPRRIHSFWQPGAQR